MRKLLINVYLCSVSGETIMCYILCSQWCPMKNTVDIFTHTSVTLWYLGVVCVLFSFAQVASNIIYTKSVFNTSGISPLSS